MVFEADVAWILANSATRGGVEESSVSRSTEQAGRRRKIVYLILMATLLLGTILVRGVVAVPLGPFNDKGKWTIQGQSDKLDLNEFSQGEVELTGSAVRLMLTGSRPGRLPPLDVGPGQAEAARMERDGNDRQIGDDATAPLLRSVAVSKLEPDLQRIGHDGSAQRHVFLHRPGHQPAGRRRNHQSQQPGRAPLDRFLPSEQVHQQR